MEKIGAELQGLNLEGILGDMAPLLMFKEMHSLNDCGEITGYDLSQSWGNYHFYLKDGLGQRGFSLGFKVHASEGGNGLYGTYHSHREINATLYSLGREWNLPSPVGEIINPFDYDAWLEDLRRIPRVGILTENGLELEKLWSALISNTKFRLKNHFESLGSWDYGAGSRYIFCRGCPKSEVKISDIDARRAKYIRRSSRDGETIIDVRREHYTLEEVKSKASS